MTIYDKIIDERLQYHIDGKAAKISALSSGKIDKYEHLTGEEILPPGQSRIKGQARCTYSPLRKMFKTSIKATENQGITQIETLKN